MDILRRVAVPLGFRGKLFSMSVTARQTNTLVTDEPLKVVEEFFLDDNNIHASTADMEEIYSQYFRNFIITMITDMLQFMRSGSSIGDIPAVIADRLAIMKAWVDAHPPSGPSDLARQRCADIYADLDGQVKEAYSKIEHVYKWSTHYLLSLQRAHELQQCNNFKVIKIYIY